MSISIESHIHRTLRKLPRFRDWEHLPQIRDIHLPLDADEKLLGAYENVPGKIDQLLLFTNLGVYLCEGGNWRSLKFDQMTNTEWITEQKLEARTLIIRMRSGTLERLPIDGGTEQTRDIFTVMRFFNRILENTPTPEREG